MVTIPTIDFHISSIESFSDYMKLILSKINNDINIAKFVDVIGYNSAPSLSTTMSIISKHEFRNSSVNDIIELIKLLYRIAELSRTAVLDIYREGLISYFNDDIGNIKPKFYTLKPDCISINDELDDDHKYLRMSDIERLLAVYVSHYKYDETIINKFAYTIKDVSSDINSQKSNIFYNIPAIRVITLNDKFIYSGYISEYNIMDSMYTIVGNEWRLDNILSSSMSVDFYHSNPIDYNNITSFENFISEFMFKRYMSIDNSRGFYNKLFDLEAFKTIS